MTQSTTIRVSKKTAEMLAHFREKIGAKSLDEAIQHLIKMQRKLVLEQSLGVEKDRISPLAAEDNG